MPTPSLLIVPARFKSGKLYSQIPTSGAGDFTVTRATAATRVNASGFIESVASGIPRLDYFASGGTVGCPALLVEPSAQNLGWHSQTWATGTTWTLGEVTTVTGTSGTLDPLGTNLANAISPTAVSGVHNFFSNTSPATIGYVSGTMYTASVFLKQGTGTAGRYAQLTYNAIPFTQAGYANFDLQLGTVAVVSGTSADTHRSASIENYGNGWYRCRFTATCNASTNTVGCNVVLLSASGDIRRPSFAGVTGDILYGFGMQLETGSIATSYIPTTTGSVTRNADVISVSGAVSGSIGQTEGVLYIECESNFANDDIIAINRDFSNAITIYKGGSNQVIGRVYASGATFSFTSSATTGVMKIALAYKSGDSALFLNGVQVGSTNTTAITFSAALNLVSMTKATGYLAGLTPTRVRAAALYTTRLSNAELAAITQL